MVKQFLSVKLILVVMKTKNKYDKGAFSSMINYRPSSNASSNDWKSYKIKTIYSQTCIKRTHLGQRISDLKKTIAGNRTKYPKNVRASLRSAQFF
jgi:hypothetical protein